MMSELPALDEEADLNEVIAADGNEIINPHYFPLLVIILS